MSTADPAEEFLFHLARHERMLTAYVFALVPHAQDADDILQDAKLTMWRSFSSFQPGTNFAAWARKIAFHRVLTYRKRQKRDRLEFTEAFLSAVAEEHETMTEHLLQRERALQDCLGKLPEDGRELLQLRYHENASLEDLSSRLKRTVGALYRQLSRLRQALHECVTRATQPAA